MDDAALFRLYADVRVADARDGLDAIGYHRFGSMSPEVRPIWRTRAHGIARTARYLPFVGPAPTVTGDEYAAWSGWYYGSVCVYPWIDALRQGDFMVLDVSGVDVGLMGSENTLACVAKGVQGFVSNGGGVRDTDEIILQGIPFSSRFVSQSMVQARLQFDAMDVPVAVGGVTVWPGDVVVADNDGVIVVPRSVAVEVGERANAEHARDRRARRAHYESAGRRIDPSVEPKP